MTVSVFLIVAIFFISLVLTMVGLSGGLIFSPLFVILGFAKKIIGGIGVGACIGVRVGLLGIGGGMFIVPLLIYMLKIPTTIAAASSTFIVCFPSLTGFLGYASTQNINWLFILFAAVASFAGGQAGARIMSTRLKGKKRSNHLQYDSFYLVRQPAASVFSGLMKENPCPNISGLIEWNWPGLLVISVRCFLSPSP